jgi:hypothetical protein
MDQAEGIQDQNIAPQPAPVLPQGVAEEKVLKQSEVNELVGRIKHEAYEKGKRDASTSNQPNGAPQQVGQSMGGMPQITDDQVRQMIREEAQKEAQMREVHQTLNNFTQQMNAGKGKYSDFDETVAQLGNMENIPHIVQLATETGNAEDVMYDLGKNPSKVASLTTLAYLNPHLAKMEMKKLLDSIKSNQVAQKTPSAPEPLSQIKPSPVGTDNGSLSMRDLRRKYRA